MNHQERLEQLRAGVLQSDNAACFIERERILSRLEKDGDMGADSHARILARLLAEVSVPLYECDYFAGRVVEARPDDGMRAPHTSLLVSRGHFSPDYERVLRVGLRGIVEEIEQTAHRLDTDEARRFAENARTVACAVRDYAARYAARAERLGKTEMARALRQVPYEPAYDLFSALQGIWIVHMIASCYVGSRDYAFGRLDQILFPFYELALREGTDEETIVTLLSGFFIKTNEICGRTAHDYRQKPILSHSSKQYVNVGGDSPNALSHLILRAACRNNMPQPQITVLLSPNADTSFTSAVFDALAVLTDKMNLYNYDLTVSALMRKGVPEDIARDHTFSACSTLDLNYHTHRREHFTPCPQIFLSLLHTRTYSALAPLLADFSAAVQENLQAFAEEKMREYPNAPQFYVFDSLLLSDSARECRYPGPRDPYVLLNLFFPGVATVGDSLMVLDRLVFTEKRYTYEEFAEILKTDFEGQEALRREILALPHFGNNRDCDRYTTLAANAFLDAIDRLTLPKNFIAMGGFYSLERDNSWAHEIGATPDGRHAGDPFSENQSPTYGMDKRGITPLLASVAKLPFHRAATGGLNVAFAGKAPAAQTLESLGRAYFGLGGLHLGVSVLNRAALEDAMLHPERYPTLTVRLYGFSEYFISLSPAQQRAIINRTVY